MIAPKGLSEAEDPDSLLLERALGALDDLFFVFTPDGEMLKWNRRLTEETGYSDQEIEKMHPTDFVPAEEVRLIERKIEETLEEGRTRVEARLQTKAEEAIPYEFTGSLLEQNDRTLICGVGRSIPGRKETQPERLISDDLYRRLFEEAHEGIAITTLDGDILRANPAAREMFGYSEAELPALNLADLYADPEVRKDLLVTLRREGAISQREIRFRTADGDEIICELSATAQHADTGSEDRESVRFLAFFRDVTVRKQAENALQESEEKFRALAEGALVGIVLVQDGTYEYVNPAFAQITGRTPEALEGRSPEEIVHPADWPTVQKNMEERREGARDAVQYQIRLLSEAGDGRSGETRTVEVRGSRINYRGTPALIATVQDVTEQRRLRREIIQVQEEERRSIGQELHDGVASQLTAARLLLSTLPDHTEEGPVEDRIRRSQKIIEESVDMVRRLSHGLSPSGLSDGDLSTALAGLAQNTKATRFERRRHEQAIDEEDPPPDDIDGGRHEFDTLDAETATHLYRIAQEATANARRYARATEIVIRLGKHDGALVLEVEDDGVGFDPSAVEEGLGLRSMRHRTDLLGADLTVDSAPGDGTLVRCRLPV